MGYTTTGFRASGYVPGEPQTHCVGSAEKTTLEAQHAVMSQRLCCLERKEANGIGGRVGEHERVGKGNPDRDKWVCGILMTSAIAENSGSTLTPCA